MVLGFTLALSVILALLLSFLASAAEGRHLRLVDLRGRRAG